MFKGSFTALITPFDGDGVDYDAFSRIADHQITSGTHGLVPVGTTGESPVLTHDEHEKVVEACIAAARGRVPVMAGAGSNSTKEAVELAQHAEKAGANAVLVVTPYYNKPNQEGLYQHFKAVNDAVSIPIYIYNIPGRSIVDMTVATMARLAQLSNIKGVKDATSSPARLTLQRLAMGEAFNQLSGDDATALAFMAHGGHGCISVTANVAPMLCSEFQTACLAGDYRQALGIHDRLMPLHEALFVEPSPGPVKYAAFRLGLCKPDTRLPLAPVTDETKAAVDAALDGAGVLRGNMR